MAILKHSAKLVSLAMLLQLASFSAVHCETLQPQTNGNMEFRNKVEILSASKLSEGIDLFNRGKFAEALVPFKEAHRINRQSVSALIWLGATYEALNKFEDAANVYKQATKIDPDYYLASQRLGAASRKLEATKNPGEIKDERKEQELKARRLCQQALEAKDAGNRTECCRLLLQALRINPTCYEAELNLGILYFEEKNLTDSLEHLGRALQINPYDPQVHLWLKKYYETLDQAKQSLQQKNP